MTVADRQRVGTLFRKNSHQLLKWPGRLTKLKLDLNSITVDQVLREWSIMEGVKPVPALDAFIVIRVNPGQTLAVRLSNPHGQVGLLRVCLRQEFLAIITPTPALNSKLDFVNVPLYYFVIFCFSESLDFVLDGLCNQSLFLLRSDRLVLKLASQILLNLLANFLFSWWLGLGLLTCPVSVLRSTLVTTLETTTVPTSPAASKAVFALSLDLELLLFEEFILILGDVLEKNIAV